MNAAPQIEIVTKIDRVRSVSPIVEVVIFIENIKSFSECLDADILLLEAGSKPSYAIFPIMGVNSCRVRKAPSGNRIRDAPAFTEKPRPMVFHRASILRKGGPRGSPFHFYLYAK